MFDGHLKDEAIGSNELFLEPHQAGHNPIGSKISMTPPPALYLAYDSSYSSWSYILETTTRG